MSRSHSTSFIDLTGQTFGRLTVLHYDAPHWVCLCSCGNTHRVLSQALRTGHAISCGCVSRETREMHGLSKTPIYAIWRDMVSRCTNPDSQSWHKYGGRGIKVCAEWLKFSRFYADMGDKPPKLSLERIDNNGDYEPDNVRWATAYDQARNTRRNLWWVYKGVTKCAEDWAREYGLKSNVLRNRIALGWSMEEALTKPVEPRRPRK